MKRIIPLLLLVIILCGCSVSSTYSGSFFAMDTYMTITVCGNNPEKAVKKAEARVKKLDEAFSAHNKKSGVYKLNKNGSAELEPDAVELLSLALNNYRITDGAFNPAMLSVTELWGFPDKNYKVPSENEIKSALKNVKPEKITVKNNTVKLNNKGMKIDFGAIAKGYTSDKLIDTLKKEGIKSALVNLGGNVAVLGGKPDGSDWAVAVENPDKKGSYLATLKIRDKSVITSGGYERYFKKNGKVYHHILNPKTGHPAESSLKSVTIVGENGTYCDALSTALFVMGKEKALRFWAENGLDFDVILYTENGGLFVTEGVSDIINSDFDYKVVKRSDYE